MMSSMASIASSSSATVRVEKATSEFLIGPDWTMNIDICDTINSNQMLAKDVVKAVKKRLQHKNPKVQLLALTLLETMVKNCGDYVHMQIAERNILQEMVKIVKKKTDMHVRDKILTLIGSWYEAFGGSGGRYPQYYIAYEDLRRAGVEFPSRPPDAAPIFTPPATHLTSRLPQPGYGMPSSSSTRLDEAMSAEENLSSSSINSMREVLALLIDMLQAIDPSDRTSVKDEVIVDLVEQCRANQKKLMQMLSTTGDEELLGQGLELNDSLQSSLAKHDAIASGSPLPVQVTNVQPGAAEKRNSSLQPAEVEVVKDTANTAPSVPVVPVHKETEEEEEEEDEFALLARRHSKTPVTASNSTSEVKVEDLTLVKTMQEAASPESPLSSSISNALVPTTTTAPVRTKDQDIIDLLSITLSTEQPSQTPTSPVHGTTQGHIPSVSPGVTFSSEAYPGHPGVAFNNYVAPWAQPRAQHDTRPQTEQQPLQQPQSSLTTPQYTQYAPTVYPPPPWASTPGYFSNPNPGPRLPNTYETPRPTPSSMPRPLRQESGNGNTIGNSSPRSVAPNAGQKPFIPSYRLFEDLNVFGSTDGGFKGTSHSSPSLSGSNNHSMVGGRK
ncbi:TOM1-like protein 6 [Primulina huaijiensis]|uniref:TOM1-like protein 6 n=1 Tax=Primulina huaijiensis TaxID=1492673 RepID=UPI003CC72A9E